MMFIDGQYLRKSLPSAFEKGTSLYPELADYLRRETQYGALYPQLIRAYYYDALPERGDERYAEQESYLQYLRGMDYFDVRVGRLKKTGDGSLKQKGVDTLIAIDMLTHAYQNHLDVAVLVAGDDDFLDIVHAVKATGKHVYEAYVDKHISQDLKESFDKRIPLVEKTWREILENKDAARGPGMAPVNH